MLVQVINSNVSLKGSTAQEELSPDQARRLATRLLEAAAQAERTGPDWS